MESIYIKLDSQTALDSRRNMLQAEINLLSMVKRLRNYADLREKEIVKKTLMRAKAKQFNVLGGVLKRELPKAEEKDVEEAKKPDTYEFKTRKKKHELEDELREIQRKLMKLSSSY